MIDARNLSAEGLSTLGSIVMTVAVCALLAATEEEGSTHGIAMFSTRNYERMLLEELNRWSRTRSHLFRHAPRIRHGIPRGGISGRQRLRQRHRRRQCAETTCSRRHKDYCDASTGFDHIDVGMAKELGVTAVRVTSYSPNSVAEFAVGLLLALNRKIPRAYNRTRDGNFELDGLMGFDLVGGTLAVIGTGKIGTILRGSWLIW